MLVLTDDATRAIEDILSSPGLPEGAGVRIAPAPSSNGSTPVPAGLQITIAEMPADTDSVIDEHGARVFVDEAVVEFLDDKLLDAGFTEEQVSFAIGDQEA